MGLPAKLASAVSAGSTFFVNFWPWLLGAFLLGMATGIYPTFKITQAIYQRQALKAQLDLSNFTATLASNAATAQAEARKQALEAQGNVDSWRQGIEAQIASGFSGLRSTITANNRQLREAISAPIYNCLREPYPAESLRLLSRPGGPVSAGDSADSSPPSSPSRVP